MKHLIYLSLRQIWTDDWLVSFAHLMVLFHEFLQFIVDFVYFDIQVLVLLYLLCFVLVQEHIFDFLCFLNFSSIAFVEFHLTHCFNRLFNWGTSIRTIQRSKIIIAFRFIIIIIVLRVICIYLWNRINASNEKHGHEEWSKVEAYVNVITDENEQGIV